MSRYIRATVALTSAIAGAVLFAAPAFAQPAEDPESGDPRATAHSGNVVGADCTELYPGSHDVTADLTATDDGTYLDITAVADGVEVVGVIVKGGPAYNQYDAADLGELPWNDLHSPHNASGKPAEISHWFACGVDEDTTTTTTTTTTDSSAPETTTSAPESSDAAVTTTTSADVSPAAEEEALAETGVNAGWLVALAAGLLIAGGSVLTLLRVRARS